MPKVFALNQVPPIDPAHPSGGNDKSAVHDFWNRASCGEELLLDGRDLAGFELQARRRYQLEPYIRDFARFDEGAGRDVLEIGVGLGADHEQWARSGARLCGIDLTPRAIQATTERFRQIGLTSELGVGDAEQLPFADASFDIVYSWGVIHHSPDTPAAVREIHRVLRAGGIARVMVYNKRSIIGLMLWTRYALLRGMPWKSLTDIYSQHLESPGTKAYTKAQGKELFAAFSDCTVRTVLTHGDLLESDAGQRHRGPLLSIARRLWPRALIRSVTPHAGLFMLIEARK